MKSISDNSTFKYFQVGTYSSVCPCTLSIHLCTFGHITLTFTFVAISLCIFLPDQTQKLAARSVLKSVSVDRRRRL